MSLFRAVVQNEVLAHELMLDPSFRLPEPTLPEDVAFPLDEVPQLEPSPDRRTTTAAAPAATSPRRTLDDFALGNSSDTTGSSTTSKPTARVATIAERSASVPAPVNRSAVISASATAAATATVGSSVFVRSPLIVGGSGSSGSSAASSDIARLAQRVTSGEAGISRGLSPQLAPLPGPATVTAATAAAIGRSDAPSHVKGTKGRMPTDPATLKMSASFWAATLRAALADDELYAAGRGPNPSPPPEGSGSAAVDLVVQVRR
jgi:hypothetical protein